MIKFSSVFIVKCALASKLSHWKMVKMILTSYYMFILSYINVSSFFRGTRQHWWVQQSKFLLLHTPPLFMSTAKVPMHVSTTSTAATTTNNSITRWNCADRNSFNKAKNFRTAFHPKCEHHFCVDRKRQILRPSPNYYCRNTIN